LTDRRAVIVILILLPTELVIPYKRLTQFYLDYVPIISPAHGLGILGVIQCWIASTVLSKYVMKFEQASGFLCFIVGCFNILMVCQSSFSHCMALTYAAGLDLSLFRQTATVSLLLGEYGPTVSSTLKKTL
jgi:hypothetical protein